MDKQTLRDKYKNEIEQMRKHRNNPQWCNNRNHTLRWDRALYVVGDAVQIDGTAPMTVQEARKLGRQLPNWVGVADILQEFENLHINNTNNDNSTMSNQICITVGDKRYFQYLEDRKSKILIDLGCVVKLSDKINDLLIIKTDNKTILQMHCPGNTCSAYTSWGNIMTAIAQAWQDIACNCNNNNNCDPPKNTKKTEKTKPKPEPEPDPIVDPPPDPTAPDMDPAYDKQIIQEIKRDVQLIDNTKLNNLVQNETKNLSVFALDAKYAVIPRGMWEKVIKHVGRPVQPYKGDVRDCDDYAKWFSAICSIRFGVNSAGIVLDISGRHAYNCLVTPDNVLFYEPQSCRIVQLGSKKMYTGTKGQIIF